MSDGYVVEVKASARKVSASAGQWVREHGSRRQFSTKALAKQWARTMSPPGYTVWVQDAVPWDDSVDGYVVGGRRVPPRKDPDPGEQAALAGEDDDA